MIILILNIIIFNVFLLHGIQGYHHEKKEESDGLQIEEEIFSEHIRILLHTTDFQSIYHPHIRLRLEGKYQIDKKDLSERIVKGILEDADLTMLENEVVRFIPADEDCRVYIESIVRNRENKYPCYRGIIELEKTEEGYIVINELPVEKYLYGVISSEMPSSYPMEALKTQAVCARTYAYRAIKDRRIKDYDADVDDSTSFQVYQNVGETEASIKAVDATRGEVLVKEGKFIDACYYSTSCGVGECGDISRNRAQKSQKDNLSKEKRFRNFIDQGREEDYEWEEAWYRWSGRISLADIHMEGMGKIKKIVVQARQKSGMISKLFIQGEEDTMVLCGEYEIRSALGNTKICITKQDGCTVTNMKLLPSAYFYMIPVGNKAYAIRGGGYGHGRGMSQNAAKHMAEEQQSYEEILGFFYENASIYKGK